jgi:CRP-like cAMP-binding protein
MIKNKLKAIGIFDNLGEGSLDTIVSITTLKTLDRGNILFYEGEDPKAFYILLEGHLKLYKTGVKCQEVVLHHFSSPTLVAEMATLENFKFPATAVAMCDSTQVAIMDKQKFIQMLHSDSGLAFHIIGSLTKKIKNLEVAINRNLILDATAKVCSLLRENPTVITENKNTYIANLLNMTPETLSRILTKLKKLSILDGENRLTDNNKLDMFLDI